MVLTKRVSAALAAALAAAAVTVPVASAGAVVTPADGGITPTSIFGPPGCPIWYGIPQPATGCTPYWLLAYLFFTHPASFLPGG